jgi:hypothetical protein
MNTRKSATRLSSAYPTSDELARYDRKARRLRAEFIAYGAASLVVALDRLVRRIACRIAGRLCGPDCTQAKMGNV